MEEIKEQIIQVLSIHQDKFKDKHKVTQRILEIIEKETIDEHKEDIYTVENIKCDLTGVSGVKHYKNRRLHRSDGEPAVIYSTGDKHWYEDGLPHRIDGPAHDFGRGWKYYYIRGKHTKTDKC